MKRLLGGLKVEITIIVSLLVLVTLLYKMGTPEFTKKDYKINVLFNFAGGITKNAPVRVLGVEAGKVEQVSLLYNDETKVLVALALDPAVKLRMDAKAYISSLTIMDDKKYIELEPGSNKAPLLEPGSSITGEDPFRMEVFTGKSDVIMEKLGKALTDVRSLTTNVDGIVTENRADVQSILKNLEATTENLKDLSTDIKSNPWKLMMKPKDWKQKL